MKGYIPMIGKLLGIASIGEALGGLHLARKFVIDVAVIVMLTIIGSMIAGALGVAGLYECDAVLVRHGLDPDMAAVFTGLFGIMILAIIVFVVAYKIHKMQNFPFKFASNSFAGSSIQSLVKGFYQGLTTKL